MLFDEDEEWRSAGRGCPVSDLVSRNFGGRDMARENTGKFPCLVPLHAAHAGGEDEFDDQDALGRSELETDPLELDDSDEPLPEHGDFWIESDDTSDD